MTVAGLDDGNQSSADPASIQGGFLSFLTLRHLRIRDLQRTVSKLRHLRIRDLQRTVSKLRHLRIRELQRTVSTLRHLRIRDLQRTVSKLRHLHIRELQRTVSTCYLTCTFVLGCVFMHQILAEVPSAWYILVTFHSTHL